MDSCSRFHSFDLSSSSTGKSLPEQSTWPLPSLSRTANSFAFFEKLGERASLCPLQGGCWNSARLCCELNPNWSSRAARLFLAVCSKPGFSSNIQRGLRPHTTWSANGGRLIHENLFPHLGRHRERPGSCGIPVYLQGRNTSPPSSQRLFFFALDWPGVVFRPFFAGTAVAFFRFLRLLACHRASHPPVQKSTRGCVAAFVSPA